MKVKELIKRLKKQDQEAEVCWQSFDQSLNECDGWVRAVDKGDPSLCEAECCEKIVVLRP